MVRKEQDQGLYEQAMAVKAGRGGLKRVISLAKRKRDQKVSPIIQGDFPGSSTDKDTPNERVGGRGAKKYLEEGYYHHIKYIAANSLAVFMWRRPLNSVSLVAPTHRESKGESKGVSNGTSIQVEA